MGDLLLAGNNIPELFKHTHFADYVVDDEHGDPHAIKQLQDWIPTLSHPSLLLYGEPGLGKTMLASALLNEYQGEFVPPKNTCDEAVLTLLRQRAFPAYFIQLAEWVGLQLRLFKLQEEAMKGIREPNEYLELDGMLQDLQNTLPFLVVDDVGKEHVGATGFALNAFDLLVRTRHNRGLSTVYTTNLPLSAWSDQYSESMESLIRRSSLHVRIRH